jgi:hypothetical protein
MLQQLRLHGWPPSPAENTVENSGNLQISLSAVSNGDMAFLQEQSVLAN